MTTRRGELEDGMRRQLAGDLDGAEAAYGRVLENWPDDADGLHLLGLVRGEQDRHDAGVDLIERAIRQRDDAAPFHHNIAGLYRRLGRLDDARAAFRRAIVLHPGYGEAYQGLAEMISVEPGDRLLTEALRQVSRVDIKPAVRACFHFALGKWHDDLGQWQSAFHHFEQANRDAGRSFDAEAFTHQVKNTIYTFDSRLRARFKGAGHTSRQPVFVVGMPRSGTTLTEQILASHPAVFGAGELPDMKQIARLTATRFEPRRPFPDSLRHVPRGAIRRLAQSYLDRVGSIAGASGAARIVDKHPLNFQYIGLILTLFPDAAIVHTERHPLATCWSCYCQHFTKGQDYAFDLDQLGRFYRDYSRLMEHWQGVFPGRIHTVRYEDLLDDLEGETRRLLAFCDLGFDDACLRFHETERVVKTASFQQVREPLYTGSRDRWQHYAPWLGRLGARLGVALPSSVMVSAGSPLSDRS